MVTFSKKKGWEMRPVCKNVYCKDMHKIVEGGRCGRRGEPGVEEKSKKTSCILWVRTRDIRCIREGGKAGEKHREKRVFQKGGEGGRHQSIIGVSDTKAKGQENRGSWGKNA